MFHMTTFTKQDQENLLMNCKRKRGEKASKIVLCNPFQNYWPELNYEDSNEFEKVLSQSLIKEDRRVRIPWKTLIKLPKEIRKESIRKLNGSNTVSEAAQLQRKHLKFGLNSVSRAIHLLKISSCLVAGDVQPNLLVTHLVTAASTRGIPILIVPKLKQITFRKLGFSCTALGISNIVDCDNQNVKALNDIIDKLWLKFPLPMNYACILRKNNKPIRKEAKSKNKCKYKCHSNADEKEASSSFIPLNSETNCEVASQSRTQLLDDYRNNLLYLRPNFRRMQKSNTKKKSK